MLVKSLSSAAVLGLAAATVPTVTLRNGVKMPMLAEGTWQYDSDTAEKAVEVALTAGFTMIDTADDYGNQQGVGEGLRLSGKRREDVFLETKVSGCGGDKKVLPFRCYQGTKSVLENNLQLLNVSYVDLVILHFPPASAILTHSCSLFSCGSIQNQWRAMEEFYQAGKARAIGVSNYCASCFACLDGHAKVFPMVNQVQYHIGMGPDAAGFRTEADKRGVVLQGYSVLGNFVDFHGADPRIVHGKDIVAIGDAHGKSSFQVALKYLVQLGIPAVTKSTNPAHLKSDLDLWSWNLTAAEMTTLNDIKIPGNPSFMCNRMEAEGSALLV